jgi:hypothetical protein
MRTKPLVAVALATTSALASIQAATVYDNSVNDLNQRFISNNLEIGDQVTLTGTDRLLSLFSLEFFATGLGGGEMARVRLYANNGVVWNSTPGINVPGSVLYDSGTFPILSSTPRSTMEFSVADGQIPNNVILPNSFTFSIQFSGIAGAESAGVDLYNPPTSGSSFNDYWLYDGATWDLRTNTGPVLNFAAHIEAVPEPSVWAICIVGGVCGLSLMRRRTSRA